MNVHSSNGVAGLWCLCALVLPYVLSTVATQLKHDTTALRKKALESTLLKALGLSELPRPGMNVIPHDYMLDLYERLSRGEHEDHGIRTVHAFTDRERRERLSLHQTYVFAVSTLPQAERILTADVRILRQTAGRKSRHYIENHGTHYLVSIYSKPANFSISMLSPTWAALDSFSFDIREPADKWLVLSVKRDVQRLRNTGQQHNAAQFIVCVRSLKTGALISPEEVGFVREGRAGNEHALLVVFLTDAAAEDRAGGELSSMNTASKALQKDYHATGRNAPNGDAATPSERRRRDSSSGSKSSNSRTRSRTNRGSRTRRRRKCRRRPLYVDFAELGWSNWVIAPDGYDAYHCDGSCDFPLSDHYKPTNHAVVQTIVNSVRPSLAPKVCCIPNRLSSISMLYTDPEGGLVYKQYTDMVVERCGCS